MKIRGAILSTLAMIVLFTACAMGSETEPTTVSSAKPVMVPYLNKSISEVKQNGYAGTSDTHRDAEAETVGQDRAEGRQDNDETDDRFGAVLKNAGAMEERETAVSELVEQEGSGTGADPVLTYLGEWTTTGYCACSECCGVWATGCTASGVLATSNHTVACGILPFGTQVMIDNVIYTVEDTGVDGEWIDIFFDSHDEALAYGMQTKSIWRLE